MTVRELVTKLGFKADNKGAERYEKRLDQVRDTALKVVAAVGSIAAGTALFAKQLSDAGNETIKAAQEAGIAADEFQRLSFALGQVSKVSQSETERALGRLGQRIGRAAVSGGKYADILMDMGYSQEEVQSGTISTTDAFEKLRKRIEESNSAQEAAAIAGDILGTRIGRRLGPALFNNADAFNTARSEADALGGVWSDEALTASEELTDSFTRFSAIVSSFTGQIAEKLLPFVNDVITDFVDWWKINRQIIQQGFGVFLSNIIGQLRDFRFLLKAVINAGQNVIRWSGGFNRVLRILYVTVFSIIGLSLFSWLYKVSKGIGLTRLALLSLQKVGILALLTGVILLLEDIVVWMNDGDSWIGKYLGSWEDFRDAITDASKKIIQALGGMENIFTTLIATIIALLGMKLKAWFMTAIAPMVAFFSAGTLGAKAMAAAMTILSKVPIVLAIIAVIFVLQDLIKWLIGSESYIGYVIDNWDNFKNKLNEVAASFLSRLNEMWKGIKQFAIDMANTAVNFFQPLIEAYKNAWQIIQGIFTLDKDAILSGFENLGNSIRNWARNLGNLLVGTFNHIIPDWMVSMFSGGLSFVRDKLFSFGNDSNTSALAGIGSNSGIESDMSSNTNQRVNVNARTEAVLQIPEGTPQQQQENLKQQAEQVFREHWNRELRKSLIDIRPLD